MTAGHTKRWANQEPAKTPSESFNEIMRFVRFISASVGCDIYDVNYRFNTVTSIVLGAIIMYWVFTIWTMIKMFEEDWMFLVEACCMGGSVIQGANKLFTATYQAHKFYRLNQQLHRIFNEYELKDQRHWQALLRSCRQTKQALMLVAIGYVFGVGGMAVTPLLASVFSGKRHMVMHFHIPGVNVHSQLGYWLTQSAHLGCLIVGAFGLYAGDITIIVFLLQSFVYADILRLKVMSLNEQLELQQLEQTDKSNDETNTSMLIDIVLWHQSFQDFVVQCNDMFYVMVSIQTITSALCIVLTIFVILTSDWPGAYPYLMVCFPNMYIYCVLGSFLCNCNDNVMFEIYNISFYNLNVNQQRIVLFMLAKSQRPDQMMLLGVMPLALQTALQLDRNQGELQHYDLANGNGIRCPGLREAAAMAALRFLRKF